MTRHDVHQGARPSRGCDGSGAEMLQSEMSDPKLGLAQGAKAEISRREQRYRFFPPDLFGEPNWDILLDTYVAYLEGRRISVSNACVAANVPATTALRYVNTLVDKGLLQLRKSESDRRVSFVLLTDTGISAMEQYLRSQSSVFKFSD